MRAEAAIATIMGNWHNVLRAINMASSASSSPFQLELPDPNLLRA